jgi:hypothetical protein
LRERDLQKEGLEYSSFLSEYPPLRDTRTQSHGGATWSSEANLSRGKVGRLAQFNHRVAPNHCRHARACWLAAGRWLRPRRDLFMDRTLHVGESADALCLLLCQEGEISSMNTKVRLSSNLQINLEVTERYI